MAEGSLFQMKPTVLLSLHSENLDACGFKVSHDLLEVSLLWKRKLGL